MNKQILYKPFYLIAGLESLVLGLTGLFIISYLNYISGTHFYGILNIDYSVCFASDSKFWVYLLENMLHWVTLSAISYISGFILSKSKIRVIDILGTTLFSRIPLLITPLIRVIPAFHSFMYRSITMYFIIGIYIFSLVWTIVLLYNAYKVSCNLKDERLIISFIFCIIVSDILFKLLINQFI